MAEAKKTAAVKPVAAIKTPVVTETKNVEVKKVAEPVKKPAVKKAPAKVAKKPAVKKAEPKKAAPAKKEAAKKPAAKKAPAKKAATKAATEAIKTNIVLQYADKNVTFDTLKENAENVYQFDMGKNVADIKKLDLYVKPEENTVYFVVNDKELGNYGL
ncbi:DUF6465 family protein [Butyrivibrio sp. VCB2006]|uniref:DUF6465 family protein n=1 Tax=Butyrivibrio sp. VCB2006 TaxID=1280679 RepID=UPI00041AAA82|nr:DUF6465 family protein [Butyrivibrio sp. VCB2006]